MKKSSLVLMMLGVALLLTIGAVISVVGAHSSMAAGTGTPVLSPSDPLQSSETPPTMEPVSCGPTCPGSVCLEPDAACSCPNGPGHCVPCNPPATGLRCVKD